MGRHVVGLDESIEVGDEFAPWGQEVSGRRVRVIAKIYNADMTISYRVQQTAGSGRMQNTVISRRWLKNSYRRVYKTNRTLYRVKTREIFAGLEQVDGAS